MSRMQEEMKKHNSKPQPQPSQSVQSYVGIDVGKDTLDIFIHPGGVTLRVMNDKKSISILIKKLSVYDIALIALEATSKYHRLAHSLFHEAGFAVSVINPFRSRQFADSIGKLAKTDKIDAESLALYAQRLTPDVTLPPDVECKELRDLQTARRQVVDEIGDLKRQLHTTDHSLAKRQIKARIAMGERHKQALEEEITKLIKSHEPLKHKLDILTSIPCIGQTTASIILSELWELGQVNAKQISALAGVAPMNWDSGQKHGNRMIRGGRQHVRNALYMCAVSSIGRSNPSGLTYKRLVERGKNPKVALTAVMRKMIVVANTLIAENRQWQPARPL